MGHDFYKVANVIIRNPDVTLQLIIHGDDICKPCKKFNDICTDVLHHIPFSQVKIFTIKHWTLELFYYIQYLKKNIPQKSYVISYYNQIKISLRYGKRKMHRSQKNDFIILP